MSVSVDERRYRIIGRVGYEGARISVAAIAPIAWLALTMTVISGVLRATRGGQLADGTTVQLTFSAWPIVAVVVTGVFLVAMRSVQRADTFEAVQRTLRLARVAVIVLAAVVFAFSVWQFFSMSLDAVMSWTFVSTTLS